MLPCQWCNGPTRVINTELHPEGQRRAVHVEVEPGPRGTGAPYGGILLVFHLMAEQPMRSYALAGRYNGDISVMSSRE